MSEIKSLILGALLMQKNLTCQIVLKDPICAGRRRKAHTQQLGAQEQSNPTARTEYRSCLGKYLPWEAKTKRWSGWICPNFEKSLGRADRDERTEKSLDWTVGQLLAVVRRRKRRRCQIPRGVVVCTLFSNWHLSFFWYGGKPLHSTVLYKYLHRYSAPTHLCKYIP